MSFVQIDPTDRNGSVNHHLEHTPLEQNIYNFQMAILCFSQVNQVHSSESL